MPRRRIEFIQGNYYHVYNRGAAQISIFRSDQDYRHLLALVKKVLAELQITMIAYCLMPNHYHWLVRQDGDIPVRLLAQRIWKSYANTFNNKYGRSGTLFEDRYKAILVDGGAVEGDDVEASNMEMGDYLCNLCTYIHTNPVKHGFVAMPELWPYSNYLDWIGKRQGTMLDKPFIADHFGTGQAYQQQIEHHVKAKMTAGQIFDQTLPPTLRYLDEG